MEFIDIILIGFSILTISMLIIANLKKYSPLRSKEAVRYFNGSVVDKRELYKERTYTHGLALVKDKKSGTIKFKKQAKMCDTALLYS